MTALAIAACVASITGSCLVAWIVWLLYKLLRDGKLKTPPTPRKPPAATEVPK